MDVAIYALIDPRDGRVFYVGQTSQGIDVRLQQHVSESRRVNENSNRKTRLINELIVSGLTPNIALLETTTPQESVDREAFWVDELKRNGCELLNGQKPGHPAARRFDDGYTQSRMRVGEIYYIPLYSHKLSDGSTRFMVKTNYGVRRVFIQRPDGTFINGKKTKAELAEEGKNIASGLDSLDIATATTTDAR